jgi:acylphosphatase
VSGRVQGVWYRSSTQQQAHALGLTGHAVNLPDGRVEVIACGDTAAIDALCAWLRQGPELAEVSAVDIAPCADPGLEDFVTG